MNFQEESLKLHEEWAGKIEIKSRVPVTDATDLALAYTPGVAEPCREIAKNPELLDVYTRRWNQVAVVSDGSAVLGLGNIGGRAAMPVMEGKSVLFKVFGGVDAFPICLDTQDPDEIVRVVQALAPTFGGVNLEDIKAPQGFHIERKLEKDEDIPIFHDDQHGTAVVVLSGVINACKITDRGLEDLHVVVNGAGAAGIACAKLMLDAGVQDLILCDSKGIVCSERDDLNEEKREMLQRTNKEDRRGSLADAMEGANLFLGVSVKDAVTPQMVQSMQKDPIIIAMANPDPEILPEEAKKAGAAVVGTGRSDFENQVNNVLGFPGIFRGALDVRATDINEAMKLASAHALAESVGDRLACDFVIPEAFDERVAPSAAAAVAKAAIESGIARDEKDPEWVRQHTIDLVKGQK